MSGNRKVTSKSGKMVTVKGLLVIMTLFLVSNLAQALPPSLERREAIDAASHPSRASRPGNLLEQRSNLSSRQSSSSTLLNEEEDSEADALSDSPILGLPIRGGVLSNDARLATSVAASTPSVVTVVTVLETVSPTLRPLINPTTIVVPTSIPVPSLVSSTVSTSPSPLVSLVSQPSVSASILTTTTTSSTPSSTLVVPASSASPLSSSLSAISRNSTEATSSIKESDSKGETQKGYSYFNPKNRMFPLVITAIVLGAMVALLIFISIARYVAHKRMREEALRAEGGSFDDKGMNGSSAAREDRLTKVGGGVGLGKGGKATTTRSSIKRAMTKRNKLSSFARRNKEDSVLIDVGDEVFAVPAHLANFYREEMIREKNSYHSSIGRSSTTNEEIQGGNHGLVGLGSSSSSWGEGLRGEPIDLTESVQGWRRSSLMGTTTMGGGGGRGRSGFNASNELHPNVLLVSSGRKTEDASLTPPGRSLSQRLREKLASLSSRVVGMGVGVESDVRESGAFSFESENQARGQVRQVNLGLGQAVLTNGSSGWRIQPAREGEDDSSLDEKRVEVRTSTTDSSFNSIKEKELPPPFEVEKGKKEELKVPPSELHSRLLDLEKQVGSRKEKDEEEEGKNQLSYERITLIDEPYPLSPSNLKREEEEEEEEKSLPPSFSNETLSRVILPGDLIEKDRKTTVSKPRQRGPPDNLVASTNLASPRLYMERWSYPLRNDQVAPRVNRLVVPNPESPRPVVRKPVVYH
ncbi:hypothetical protein IE53DRAFT_362442 [Violaceomyces palustris]|uniref:Uncharacterized protein n=1 Tax=Violaceomyces palustris TaxID=1673888 RepID=A0ACD0NX55_9BASI|nr:hypothetical protein IE53DRAFT_362442 [Violaceomyces palustris]